jgi:hypothetical protein
VFVPSSCSCRRHRTLLGRRVTCLTDEVILAPTCWRSRWTMTTMTTTINNVVA